MGPGALKMLLSFQQTLRQPLLQVGGKALVLARMNEAGFNVPHALCLPASVYRQYLADTDLEQRIAMELGRKAFADMRWEELWDAALRIRHLFLAAPLPASYAKSLWDEVEETFGDRPLVVRSSAPGEDSSGSSFAGLHESLVNVRGPVALEMAVRKVWASLWSDRALLYRQELGLDVHRSAMAVLIQELVSGEKSGVAFSRSPVDPQRTVIEAVWGLNQGLVDGSIEPDHWELDRDSGQLLEHRAAARQQALLPGTDGVQTIELAAGQAAKPPLDEAELARVAALAQGLEDLHGRPQDVEWTFDGPRLLMLQSRAVTARHDADADDQRVRMLSLHRSVTNLQQLRQRIEQEVMPGMEAAAAELATVDPASLSDQALADEIRKRRRVLEEWEAVYRSECIPMAHGVRVFGEFYNDQLQPADPFAFTRLLQGAGMRAVKRNRELVELAAEVRGRQDWQRALAAAGDLPVELAEALHPLADSIGLSPKQSGRLLLELARKDLPQAGAEDPEILQTEYLAHFGSDRRSWAAELLELGRASYRLRDDDNLSMDRIHRQVHLAEEEGRRRLAVRPNAELTECLKPQADDVKDSNRTTSPEQVRVRQIQGQPAGAGVASASARIVSGPQDLADFRAGEILVCDAIDPAMTFIVPLAAAVVERRGGMLIHGAIIAREYGLPCVTGIRDAADIIRTGDRVTVDGYLGIVIIDRQNPDRDG